LGRLVVHRPKALHLEQQDRDGGNSTISMRWYADAAELERTLK
jgi:hypothetical protein